MSLDEIKLLGWIFLIVFVPIFLVLFLLYKLWTKSAIVGKVIVILFMGFLIKGIYQAIYPLDDFYKNEFEMVSGLIFPDDAKIVAKTSTYPDMHGDYGSCAIFTVLEDTYLNYDRIIDTNKSEIRTIGNCNELFGKKKIVKMVKYEKGGGEIKEWGILDDNRSVFFKYFSF